MPVFSSKTTKKTWRRWVSDFLNRLDTLLTQINTWVEPTSATDGQVLTADGAGDSAWEDLPAAEVIDYIKLSDTKTANSNGGTFSSGAWRNRTLNTEDTDTGDHCSLASDVFTLAAGTYRIFATAPAYDIDRHKAKLYNNTDASNVIIGSSEYAPNINSGETRSIISGQFTTDGTKGFRIQHRCQATKTTTGLGVASNFSVSEIYTIVELWKVA